jgi:hypothetical protein
VPLLGSRKHSVMGLEQHIGMGNQNKFEHVDCYSIPSIFETIYIYIVNYYHIGIHPSEIQMDKIPSQIAT